MSAEITTPRANALALWVWKEMRKRLVRIASAANA
jgi:hypothetical protein